MSAARYLEHAIDRMAETGEAVSEDDVTALKTALASFNAAIGDYLDEQPPSADQRH